MGSVPKRIGIFGNFGIGNFGNDATLESMLLLLKQTQPDVEITCVCTVPEKVGLDHGIPALPFRWLGPSLLRKLGNWCYAISVVRRFDVLIIPGTGILNDFCTPPLGLPYILFRWCLAARLCGVRIALVSVGAGPLHHPVARWFIKRAALAARYRSYRNNFSKEFLESLGVNTSNDPVYPDIAFSLPSPPSPPQESAEAKSLIVCVGAMDYHGWCGHLRTDNSIYEGYIGKLTDFVLWLLEHDHVVRIIMGGDGEGDQKAVDDLRNSVLARKSSLSARTLIAEAAHSQHDVMRQMADADIVISSRFHNLVFALMLGKLTISIGYAEYHAELMADMGMGAFCQHSENIKMESLITQFTELVSNRSHYEAIVRNAVISARERLAHQDSVFKAQFLDPSKTRNKHI
jgi:polysaccharide pyruvyl transferase WcaK-like protein